MKLYKLILIFGIIAIASSICYASMDDKSDRLSSNQSSVFSPGYVNASMQKTREIIRQVNQGMHRSGQAVDQAEDNVAQAVREDAVTRVEPELKKKSAGSGDNKNPVAETNKVNVIEGGSTYEYVNHDIARGHGTEQEWLDSAHTILGSERIDGIKYIYAGFGGYTMQQAVNRATAADVVAVAARAGLYDDVVDVNHGCTIRGGYEEDGRWNQAVYSSAVDPNDPNRLIDRYQRSATPDNNVTETRFSAWGGINITSRGDSNPIVIEGMTFDIAYGKPYSDWVCWYGVDIRGVNDLTLSHCNFLCADAGIYAFGGGNKVTITYSYFNCSFAVSTYGFSDFTIRNCIDDSYRLVLMYGRTNLTMDHVDVNIGTAFGQTGGATGNHVNLKDLYYQPFDTNMDPSQVTVENVRTQPNYIQYASAGTTLPNWSDNLRDPYFNEHHDNTPAGYTIYGGPIGNAGEYVYADPSADKLSMDSDILFNGLSIPLFSGSDSLSMGRYALAVSMTSAGAISIEDSMMLAAILRNPTEDQKLILDARMALLQDVNKTEKESVSPEAIKKASDNLLQVVANILIAQAIPDLFKESDIANIKATFEDLNTQKARIISEYNLAIQPYYKEVKKLLAKNLALLQFNNIVSKTMVEDELSKLEPNDVDKLLEKLRKISGQSQDADSLLSQEDKLHKQYLDPNKKLFEDRMKAMLEGFTQRLSKILEAKKGK